MKEESDLLEDERWNIPVVAKEMFRTLFSFVYFIIRIIIIKMGAGKIRTSFYELKEEEVFYNANILE